MSATVTYKGVEIATVENETKTLNTAGTYCEADIEVTDVSSGGSQLYIFTYSPYQQEFISINGASQTPRTSYSSQALVEGVTINFNTYSDWILKTITGVTSGTSYPFTTISPTSYTFTMPGESVYCNLIYDD